MTIETLAPVNRYRGDGVQTAFPVGFPVFGDGRHVRAVVSTGEGGAIARRELVYGVDYTVSDITGGGECVTTTPVPDGHALTLYLDLPFRQPRDFNNLGRLDAEEIEKGLDYVTVLTAQNAAALERAVTVSVDGEQTPEELLADIFNARDTARTEAAGSKAEADRSAREADRAKTEADRVRSEADRVHGEANRAQGEADRAEAQAANAAASAGAANSAKDAAALSAGKATAAATAAQDSAEYAGDVKEEVKAALTVQAKADLTAWTTALAALRHARLNARQSMNLYELSTK